MREVSMSNAIAGFKKKLSEVDVVSFDVFGTLLQRYCTRPSFVFDLAFARWSGCEFEADSAFARARSSADDCAVFDRPMTLDEIYERLTLFTPQEREELKKLEIDCERRVLTARPDVRQLFEEAVALGKRIVITSDMYLSSETLSGLLESNGYKGVERIFVSCEWSCEKATGELLTCVAKELGVRPERILHVGDSFKADIRGARISGIDSFYVGENLTNKLLEKTPFNSSRTSTPWGLDLLFSSACHRESVGFGVGFKAVAPLVYCFCSWLHGYIASAGDVDGVYFLARDANLLYETYLRMFPDENKQLHYVHLSRKTCYPAILSACESIGDVPGAISLPRYLSLRMLGDCLGLVDEDGFEGLVVDKGLSMDSKWSREDLFENASVKAVLEEVFPNIRRHAEEQASLLVRYLLQRGFNEKSVIVDDGWHGTCQRCLERAVGWPLRGYYLGTSETSDLRAYGYLYDDNRRGIDDQLAGFGGLFEMLMSTGEGPTIAYCEDSEGRVEPVLGQSELSRDSLALIEEVRRGTLAGVCSIHSVFQGAKVADDPEAAFEELERLGDMPTKNELELFGSISYANNGAVFRLVTTSDLREYIRNPSRIKVDFFDTNWRTGFLKQLFHMPIDYGVPYRVLRYAFHQYER